MTATDELRRLLDERGVEWTSGRTEVSRNIYTDFSPDAGMSVGVWESRDGKLAIDAHTDYRLTPAQAIAATLGPKITGDTSDGYHTFNELYHHRAVLFSVIVRDHRELAWKSMRHHDGTMYDGMFIVGIETPEGQATYHYDIDPYWDMFNCKELDQAPEWDGHTPDEAIERIGKLATLVWGTCHDLAVTPAYSDKTKFECSECGYEYSAVGGFGCDYGDEPDFRFCPNCGRRCVG